MSESALFGADAASWERTLVQDAADAGEDVAAALDIARGVGTRLPLPGAGATASRWRTLAAIATANLTVARVLEAHSDALAILAEAGLDPGPCTWGVFAAEAPGVRLDAVRVGGAVQLTGTKPWCSLGGALDAALVTARLGAQRQLFRVDLRQQSVRADPSDGWIARGLRAVPSGPVHFEHTPAQPVGEPGWYLRRPGFAWGGIGVAACWFGGARGIAHTLTDWARGRDGDLPALHVGAVDAALHAAGTAMEHAARQVDIGDDEPALLALRTRAVVASSVEFVLQQAGRALGPAPLAFDAAHAARVADLTLYVRQHHGERDLAALGAELLERGAT